MASTIDGVKGYCLNYDSRIMYPYTLLDCIIAPDGSTSGSAAIIEGLIGDNINTDCVLGFKRAEGGLVALGTLKQDISNPPQFLDETGTFREVNLTDLAHNFSAYIGSNDIVQDNNGGQKITFHSDYFDSSVSGGTKRIVAKLADSAKSASKLSINNLTGNWLYEFVNGVPAQITSTKAGLNTTDAKLMTYGSNGFAFSTMTLGSANKPVYLSNGKFMECNEMTALTVDKANLLACSLGADSVYVGWGTNQGRFETVPNNISGRTYVLSVADESGTSKIRWKDVGSMTAISLRTTVSTSRYYMVGSDSSTLIDSNHGTACQTVYCLGGTLYNTSDERLKTFTDNIDINLDNLATIKKGLFYWNDDEEKRIDIGVTAQSVEALYPQLVDEVNGTKHVAYAKLSVVALAAIDKLNRENKKLKKDIQNLEDKIKYLEEKLDEI